MRRVCPKLDCAPPSFIKSFSCMKATVHSDTQQKAIWVWCRQNVLQLCPSLNYISGDAGRENGIEFQRSSICLNEVPLMLRGGWASKRGGIDSEIMLVCVNTDECVLYVCTWLCSCLAADLRWAVLEMRRGRARVVSLFCCCFASLCGHLVSLCNRFVSLSVWVSFSHVGGVEGLLHFCVHGYTLS